MYLDLGEEQAFPDASDLTGAEGPERLPELFIVFGKDFTVRSDDVFFGAGYRPE